MTFQPTLTNSMNGRFHEVSAETTVETPHSSGASNPSFSSITRNFNTQLLTHYGYYLSPRPTIQQLKK